MANILELPESSKIDLVVHMLIPSASFWHAKFAMACIDLVAHFATVRAVPWARSQRLQPVNSRSSHLLNLREGLLQGATKCEAHYALFLDSDMTFPKDSLHRLLAHHKPVVGVNYSTKSQDDPVFTACADDTHLVTDANSSGLVEVDHLGCGVLLINLKDLAKVPPPWFGMPWLPELKAFLGEDVFFCRKAQKHGLKCYVDQDLSKEVEHWGDIAYKWDTTSAWMQEKKMYIEARS